MLASIAADMLNQSRTDLGIPNRINLTTSRSSGLVLSLPDLNFDSVADTANGIRQRISPDAIKAEVADYIKLLFNRELIRFRQPLQNRCPHGILPYVAVDLG